MTDTPLIFLHNFRCSGNTINMYFVQQTKTPIFKLGTHHDRVLTYGDFLQAGRQGGAQFYLGHFVYGAHRHLSGPARYFTNIRKPLARMVSGYLAFSDFQQPLLPWLETHFEADNGMTKRLAGIGVSPEDGVTPYDYIEDRPLPADFAVDEAVYERAARTLDACAGVIIQERFSESLVMFERNAGLNPLVCVSAMHFNRSLSLPLTAKTVPDDVRALMATKSAFDERLYARANARLDGYLAEQTADFHNDVRLRSILRQMLFETPNTQGFLPAENVGQLLGKGLDLLVRAGAHEDVIGLCALLRHDPHSSPAFLGNLKGFLAGRLDPALLPKLEAALTPL